MASPQRVAEPSKKTTSSVHDVTEGKPAFGSRFLTNEEDVWTQNAWDHVPPPEDQVETISKSLSKQRLNPVPLEEKQKLNEKPARHWDNFYKMNANNFFRNRKWLHNEFPELVSATKADAGSITITEVGCGAGNSVFPLLSANQNPDLSIRAYDYSSHAVKLVQNNPLYLSPPVGNIQAAVWDVTSSSDLPAETTPGTVDIVILVFVLSALHPDEWGRAINNIHQMLKPGGVVLLRDYGRYDLTQLRFKGGRMLDENFYIRGDKTRVYFFELDELSLLFTGSKVSDTRLEPTVSTTEVSHEEENGEENRSGTVSLNAALDAEIPPHTPSPSSPSPSHASQSTPREETPLPISLPVNTSPIVHPNLLAPLSNCPPHPLFAAEQLGVDRRLIVNRKRQLKMYRVWMQAKFRNL
ncbi:S-adenosyl-L-methionine-dependent methyltransferase [Gymnopilus junonius]|uniref:tRNA N(3)-methylcytidine methyltransferase n=1 Tax=Gymnopilus junonius TaxID=109634 RepID=A0A9P5TN18_GYMJU|nr:S-adenosyl-L-methionine-dependent methyltransferase [Gymnopilus junonius]